MIDALVRYILKDWTTEWGVGGLACKFCLIYQQEPSVERHLEGCPRMEWALKNNDLPKDRTERFVGHTIPLWTEQLQVITPVAPPVYTRDGDFMRAVLRGDVLSLEERNND